MAKYVVFISYSRKDTATSDRICEAFDRVGITYFIDRQGISAGEEFPKVLASAINESGIFLFLASEISYQSSYTRTEVMYAFKKKLKDGMLVPYIVDDSKLPDDLDLVLSTTNILRMSEHPIESVLLPDLLRLLGREVHPTMNNDTQHTFQDREFTVNGVSFKMIYVEGGTFQMGATPEQGSEAFSYEKPVHSVTLSSYHIGETPVTQALWKAVMGNNPSYFKGDNLPVETVSWNDCQEFIQKLNQLTGKKFRLPTEAEWEYAARGGKHHSPYKYAGNNNIEYVAWYWKNSGDKYLTGKDDDWDHKIIIDNHCKTHLLKTKKPNALGIYDMSGNVWEWCQDWYGAYSGSAQTDPQGPAFGSVRVLRGGSWYYNARYCRVSSRDYGSPGYCIDECGFRLAP